MRRAALSVRKRAASSRKKTKARASPAGLHNNAPTVEAAQISSEELPWLGRRVPNGYWDYRTNRVKYLEWLGQQCGFVKSTDWYGLRKHHFRAYGGGGLYRNKYRSSILRAMQDFRPWYDWKPWLFGGTPNGFWKVTENRKAYMDWLATKLGVRSPQDWYSVTSQDFLCNDGAGLLNVYFKASVQALLSDYMPDFPWKPWLFGSVPQSFWRAATHRRAYLTWLGDQLGFENSDDWSCLKREDFDQNGGSGLLVGYYRGSVGRAVEELFS